MIVVAIIGGLSAIAIPKFAQMIQKSRDGSTKGNLGGLRSALSIYYGEQTFYPGECVPNGHDYSGFYILHDSLVPKYLDQVPVTRTGYHVETNTVLVHWINPADNNKMDVIHDPSSDASGDAWQYASDCDQNGKQVASTGQVFVECSHTDSRGSAWNLY